MSNQFPKQFFDEIDRDFEKNGSYFTEVLDMFVSDFISTTSIGLDVGCGTGVHMRRLSTDNLINLYGTDTTDAYRDRLEKNGYKGFKVMADIPMASIPDEDECFDFVVCKDVLEHVLHPEHSLLEIKRVLKSGGYALLHVPNHFSVYGRLKFLFSNRIDTFNYFNSDERFSYPHIRFYEHRGFVKKLEQLGFKLCIDYSSTFPAIPLIRFGGLYKLISKRIAQISPANFSHSITVLVRKM